MCTAMSRSTEPGVETNTQVELDYYGTMKEERRVAACSAGNCIRAVDGFV